MPIRPSSPAFAITSYGKRFSRSISSAIGRTSPSAKSRARRWMSRCSSVRSNTGRGRLLAAPALLARQRLRPAETVEQLPVRACPGPLGFRFRLAVCGRLLRVAARLGRAGGDRGVARVLLAELAAQLGQLALARGEEVAEVVLHVRDLCELVLELALLGLALLQLRHERRR